MLDATLRASLIYVFLIVVFRLAGKRTLGQATTFDFMLLLIISEAVSAALSNGDQSLARAVTLVLTLVGLNVLTSFLKLYSPLADRIIDGTPTVLIRDGVVQHAPLRRARLDLEDLREAARQAQGIDNLADVRLATLERSGHISIVAKHP